MPASEFWNSKMRRASSVRASVLISGTSASSGCEVTPAWNGITTNLSRSH
jgi:hypothetical protein